MTIADKIAVELVGCLFQTVKDPTFVGEIVKRPNRMGETDLKIDEEIYNSLDAIASVISKKYGLALRIVSESDIKQFGFGDLYCISLDECDGSVNRDPIYRSIMIGVGFSKTGQLTTKEITSGAIMRFDGTLFYTDEGTTYFKKDNKSKLVEKPKDIIHDYTQIGLSSHCDVNWNLYSEFVNNLGKKIRFNPRIYGSTGGEIMALMLGFLEAEVDLRGLHGNPPKSAKVWDIAAPGILLKNAGFVVTDGKGKDLDYNIESKEIISFVAAPPKLHKIILDTIKETFKL